MKRLLLYGAILGMVLTAPAERSDVGKLQPIQTVAVYRDGEYCVMETDMGDIGRGGDLQEAFELLIATTPADIYLNTAQFLLVAENTESEIDWLRTKLKDSVEVYRLSDVADLKEVSKFLEIHGNGPTLKSWKNGTELPSVSTVNGRIILT